MVTFLIMTVALTPMADANITKPDDELVLQLTRLVGDRESSPWARLEALRTLGHLGPEARAAVPQLAVVLARCKRGDDTSFQHAIVATLGKIGPAARSVLPALTKAAGQDFDLDRAIRLATTQILASPESVELQDLIRQLRSPDASVRMRAAKALTRKGPRADPAVGDLVNLLQDSDADVRRATIGALRAIQPDMRQADAIVQAYVLDLQDSDDVVRLVAARMLGRLGAAAAAAAPALQKAQNDTDPDVRRAAGDALSKITPQ